ACPQDNGGHERMHRDMAAEVESVPAPDMAAEQRELDRWRQEFNHVRPHDDLAGKTPAEVYRPSSRRFRGPVPASYPPHFLVKPVTRNGNVCVHGNEYFVGTTL